MIQPIQKIDRINKADNDLFRMFEEIAEDVRHAEMLIKTNYEGYSLDHGHILDGGIY